MKALSKFTIEETKVLLFLEECMYRNQGRLDFTKVDDDTVFMIRRWGVQKFISLEPLVTAERLGLVKLEKTYTHAIRFSSDAWEMASVVRRKQTEWEITSLYGSLDYPPILPSEARIMQFTTGKKKKEKIPKVTTIPKMWKATSNDGGVMLFSQEPVWIDNTQSEITHDGSWYGAESICIRHGKKVKCPKKTLKQVKVTIEEVPC